MSVAEVLDRLRPVLDELAATAAERDRTRELPREQLRALAAAGVGALRVPTGLGGAGLTIPELAEVWVELATADPNATQALRGHFAFAEDRLVAPGGPDERWLARLAAGGLVGNAWSETGNALGGVSTRARRADGGWLVDGRKYYTTGSIFADWIDATVTGEDGAELTALVPAAQEGVEISDDWDGFGQRTTGTGGIVFTAARVDDADVLPFADRFRYQTAFYQLTLLAVLAGIARRAELDLAEQLRTRSRVYSHGNADAASRDPQLLAVAGQLSAGAFAARAIVREVAEAVQRAADTAADRDSAEHRAATVAAEIASAQGQVVLTRLVPELGTILFDALGASAVAGGRELDRHWRNARTVSSHNPALFKARIVGDWSVNGTEPTPLWSVGAPQAAPAPAPAPPAPEEDA